MGQMKEAFDISSCKTRSERFEILRAIFYNTDNPTKFETTLIYNKNL